MTNSCSLSKARIGLIATVLIVFVDEAYQVLTLDWVSAGVELIALAALAYAYRCFVVSVAKIETCTAALAETSQGRLDARVLKLGDTGIVGSLGRNINQTLDLAEAFVKEANAAMEYANNRRYFRKIVPTGLRGSYIFFADTINKSLALMSERDGEFKHFVSNNVAAVATTVSSASTQLAASANTISGLSTETGRESVTAASGAERASANVQAVASAVEEFTAATAEIAQQVNRVATISKGAVEQLGKSDATISQLAEATAKIGNVLDIISKIAEKTKLLSLNATIEAARAGEAGKGFTVVASEVKALAEQTAHATKEISTQVDHMRVISNDTVTVMRTTGEAVREISSAASTVAAAAEEQNAASNEIARNLTEAVTATGSVSAAVSKVDRAAQETAQGIAQVSSASTELSKQAVSLMSEVKEFLSRLDRSAVA